MTEKKKSTARELAAQKVKEDKTEDIKPVKPTAKDTPKNETSKKKPKVKLSNETEIEIMNNTTGIYGYIGRSGFAMDMTEYGDILEIPFGELKRMRAEQPRHLQDAFIVVLNEDAIKELRLEKLYEGIVNDTGLDELFNDHKKLGEVLPKMPAIMKETVAIIAKRGFKNDTLHDNRVKKVIEDNLKIKIEI